MKKIKAKKILKAAINEADCPVMKEPKQTANQLGSKYQHMFPKLRVPRATEETLIHLGCSGSVLDDTSSFDYDSQLRDNQCVPAGFTIFAQFIAHDITADKSTPQQHKTIRNLVNYRIPKLDLEPVYAGSPITTPYLYDCDDPDKFLIGTNDKGFQNDLPRNSQGKALIGDQRNDVHTPMSQLHLAFLKFHNATVDFLRTRKLPEEAIYPEAQRLARWHYQWIILHEFLPLTIGQKMINDILNNGRKYYNPKKRPFIPVEFADAAYRYGHSQIRAVYSLNENVSGPIYPDFAGFIPVSQKHVIDWKYFFEIEPSLPPQPTRKIDTKLTHVLIRLPDEIVGKGRPELASLAVRDLLRGKNLDLPSGEALAEYMDISPLTKDEVGLSAIEWKAETPLWFYILKEAMVKEGGERLGQMGGRIVGEVLIGLLQKDPYTYLSYKPDWTPTLPAKTQGAFTMVDLLRFADVV